MARLFIKNVSQRDKIQNISTLATAEREALVRAVEANTPQFLASPVANPPSGYDDVGIYFNVEKNRTYAFVSEVMVDAADPDALSISIGITTELTQLGEAAGIGIDVLGGAALVSDTASLGRVGYDVTPLGASAIKWARGTAMFRADDSVTLSVQVSSTTTLNLLAGSNFALYEINQND